MIQLKSSARSLAIALSTVALAALAVPALTSTACADTENIAPPAAAADQGARGGRAGTRVSVAGEVGRYVVGPLGHVRGFVLKDGTAVLVHGTAGDTMAQSVKVGESVRVEGWSPAAAGGKAIMHAAVYGQHGQVVTPPQRGERERDPSARGDRGAEKRAELARLPEASANGTVQNVIQGPRGKVVAVVLSDGTSVFLRHGLAHAVESRGIRQGDRIQSTGKGASYPLGTSLMAGSITFADGTRFEAPARDAQR